jgi:hypothetical protein
MKTPKAFFGIVAVTLGLAGQLPAQFTFTTNQDGSLNLVGYTGSNSVVVIPDTTNGAPIVSIGDAVFIYDKTLTQITIGTNVTSMGASVFADSGLAAITFPNRLTSIGQTAFLSCRLRDVTLPNSLTNLGSGAFDWCNDMTNVVLGNGITELANGLFSECGHLTTVTLPENLTTIGDSAFWGAQSLVSIAMPTTLTYIGGSAFGLCPSLSSMYCYGNAPSVVSTALPSNASVYYLAGTTGWGPTLSGAATSLWYPPVPCAYSVTNGSVTLSKYLGSDDAVSIPNSINGLPVTTIGTNAFSGCGTLTNVFIPTSVTNIVKNPFAGCAGLVSITVDPLNSYYSSLDGVLFNWRRTTLIGCPNGKATSGYTIPNSVFSIGAGAFASCAGLSSVTIPSGVTNIGDYAFGNCQSLKGIYFQGNAPSVVSNAFGNDYRVVVYYLPWNQGWTATYAGISTIAWDFHPIVQNGGFEEGDFRSWSLVGTPNTPYLIYNAVLGDSSGYAVVRAGRYGAALADGQVARLSQTLSTVPGQYYLLSLWLDNAPGGSPESFSVNWNTNNTTTNTLFTTINPPAFGWTNLEFLVMATDTNTTLEIRAENVPGYFGLDEISVTPVPPIPPCHRPALSFPWPPHQAWFIKSNTKRIFCKAAGSILGHPLSPRITLRPCWMSEL